LALGFGTGCCTWHPIISIIDCQDTKAQRIWGGGDFDKPVHNVRF